MAHLTIGEWKL